MVRKFKLHKKTEWTKFINDTNNKNKFLDIFKSLKNYKCLFIFNNLKM